MRDLPRLVVDDDVRIGSILCSWWMTTYRTLVLINDCGRRSFIQTAFAFQ
jgi:hypothetical protein